MRIPRPFSIFRAVVLIGLALVPVVTLVHRDDLGRWDGQRSAMAAPDEFSYLLMARHFMQGGGLSLQHEIGRDTFYPPGYPLLLAAWGKCFGLTAFTAHALNATLLAVATVLAFFLCRRLLRRIGPLPPAATPSAPAAGAALSARAIDILALLMAGIFATNWHVLETSLLVMSEPAFMVATFAWLLVALRWADWPEDPWRTLAVAVLAIAAWSIRGAGIVCVGTTLAYAMVYWVAEVIGDRRGGGAGRPPASRRLYREGRLAPVIIVLTLVIAYQAVLAAYSQEKSLLAGRESANSYPKQLLRGLLVEAPAKDDPHPWATVGKAWVKHMYDLVGGHLQDYAASFVPWPREEPDASVRTYLGWWFGLLGLSGFFLHAWRVVRGRLRGEAGAEEPAGGFLVIYVFLYAGLYLVWPFNFARFWSPLLPLMLVYIAAWIVRFSHAGRLMPRWAPAAALLTCLLILSAEEVTLQLGFYARRLNYVSDALRDGVRAVMRAAPDAQHVLVTGKGDDELYALAWYFAQEPGGASYRLRAPEPHLPVTGKYERADQMLVRSADELRGKPGERLFFFSYFPGANHDTRDTLLSIHTLRPEDNAVRVFQKGGDVGIWEIRVGPATTRATTRAP
jgi:hypothetical protein